MAAKTPASGNQPKAPTKQHDDAVQHLRDQQAVHSPGSGTKN